jgi:hypothetical protein
MIFRCWGGAVGRRRRGSLRDKGLDCGVYRMRLLLCIICPDSFQKFEKISLTIATPHCILLQKYAMRSAFLINIPAVGTRPRRVQFFSGGRL